jgi:PAS domain S-box-containing protein
MSSEHPNANVTDNGTPIEPVEKPVEASGVRDGLALLLVFLLLAAGIVVAGILYYQQYARDYRAGLELQLSTIADLKVDELVQYRKERLEDAAIFSKNAVISALVRHFLEKPEDEDAQRQIQIWIEKYQKHGDFDVVRLLDVQGATRLSSPSGLPPVSSVVLQRIPEIMRAGQVTFLDFHRNEYDQQVYLDILVPILDEQAADRPLGLFYLRINPKKYLYPFIKQWPVPSQTAETLLVRREGNEVVFLNELRFRTNTALNLRISLANTNVAAVKAALGQTGIVEGRDYRGAPVIADVRAVPGSPWFIVARQDATEMFAPLRAQFWRLIFTLGILLLGAGAGVGLVRRQQSVRFYRRQLETEAERIRLGAIVEFSEDAIIGKNLDGTITSWNAGAERIYGYRAAETVGKSIAMLLPPGNADELLRLMEKIRRGEVVEHYETGRIRKNGECIQMSLSLSPVKDAAGTIVGVSAIGRDITERKLAEEKIKLTLADLERSNQELEHFAYVASHDLQEPLRMVSSYTQLLGQRYAGQLDDKAAKYIHYAVDGAIRMQTLINDLLTYSRVGRLGKPPEPTDSHSVLGEAIRNLAITIAETRAVITNDDLPTVRADASQLVLLFQNLLANAIKFRRAELPRIHVSARERGGEWLFSFKDNGIGIAAQYAERVFIIFQRLHTREEYPGTGIGLAVCKRIVERHAGKIWFESEPGSGTTFFFTIPK